MNNKACLKYVIFWNMNYLKMRFYHHLAFISFISNIYFILLGNIQNCKRWCIYYWLLIKNYISIYKFLIKSNKHKQNHRHNIIKRSINKRLKIYEKLLFLSHIMPRKQCDIFRIFIKYMLFANERNWISPSFWY